MLSVAAFDALVSANVRMPERKILEEALHHLERLEKNRRERRRVSTPGGKPSRKTS